MKTLWIATTNKDKVREIKALLEPLEFEVHSAGEIPAYTAPNENGSTFQANALIKARYLHSVRPDDWVLADDSGIEVDALNGLPGVHSARYAGPRAMAAENNLKLLRALTLKPPGTPRTARFKCVLCLMPPASTSDVGSVKGNQSELFFEGVCEGKISTAEKGKTGFGYDPIFVPNGFEKTIAELGLAVKNKLSHRAQALRKMIEYLKSLS